MRVILMAAAVIVAVFSTNDVHIVQNVLETSDPFIPAIVYLTIGAWIGVIINLILSLTPLGKVVDADFVALDWMSLRAQRFAFYAGLMSAAAQLFLLWGAGSIDPGALLPLSNVSLLFIVLYETWKGKIDIKEFALPALLVMLGAFLVALGSAGGWAISLLGLSLPLIKSLFAAASRILEQKGTKISDGTNFSFWRFFWLAVTGTVMSIVTAVSFGKWDQFVEVILTKVPSALPWIMFTMFLVYFSVGIGNTAKKYLALSEIHVVMSLPVVLGIPATLLVNWMWPGTFSVPTDPGVWVMRSIGAVLVLWGVRRMIASRSSQKS